MSSTAHNSIANRFAALAVDNETPVPSPAPLRTSPPTTASYQSQQAPRRAYVPPNMRHNQVPVTQSRLAAPPPNVTSASDFPSLGSRHTPAAAKPAQGGAGWASRARSWAEHDEHAAEIANQERRQRQQEQQEQQNMITLTRSTLRSARQPTLAPGTSEFIISTSRRYVPSYSTEEDEGGAEIDAAEAYVGGYDHTRYTAYDYEEAADQYGPQDGNENEYNDGRYTPPYPPNPY